MAATASHGWEGISQLLHTSISHKSERKIGIEIERIGLWTDGTPLPYHSRWLKGVSRPGAEDLLRELEKRHGWAPVKNPGGELLGFSSPTGKVSLEPGSQLEFSADAVSTLREMARFVDDFEAKVDAITRPWGLHWIGLGVHPLATVESVELIPSTRYRIMTEYLGSRDTLGTSMMRLTSSVQLNFDYTDESEGIEMLRVALAAAPVSYALFANSPLLHGKPAGLLSFRSEIWRHTDSDRSGLMPEVFSAGFNFERYAEAAWRRPLMFAQDAKGNHLPANGHSLAEISAGALPGVTIDAANLLNAVREIFTEARLKPGYVEVRSIDGLRPKDRFAAAAFWLGLLYHEDARQLVIEKLGALSPADRENLNAVASREGLHGQWKGLRLKTLAESLYGAARDGLKKRGFGEEEYLAPIEENLAQNTTPAERALAEYRHGDPAALIHYCSR